MGRGRVGSIGSVGRTLTRSGMSGRTQPRSYVGARVGRLVHLAQSDRGLAGLGDGPMSPSPRVMNSIYVYIHTYI
jgi:hypothetical protein